MRTSRFPSVMLFVLLSCMSGGSNGDGKPGQDNANRSVVKAKPAQDDTPVEKPAPTPKNTASKDDSTTVLKEADQLWSNGKKHEAAEIYQRLLDKAGGLALQRSDRSRAYSRTVDSLVERGGPEAGRELVRIAVISRLPLVLSNPDARRLLADAQAKEDQFLSTPPDTTGTGEVSGAATAEQLARRNNAVARDLKAFTSEKDMRSTYGPPTALHQSSVRKNACLIAWDRTRQSGEKEFLAITFLRRVDGRDEPIIIHADVVLSLDRLKGMLNSKAVLNP